MHILLSVPFAVSLFICCTIAQVNYPYPVWFFPFRVTLANGEGNGSPSRPTSFADNVSVNIDLTKSFTLMGWLGVANRIFWRAALSIESDDATAALFRIALPPDEMTFNVAWMQSAQARGGSITTAVTAPGPNVNFHFAIVKNNSDVSIYVDGVNKSTFAISGQIFNPQNKRVVLGRTKLDGNSNRSQWNGILRDVYLFDFALTDAEVQNERAETLVE